MSGGFFQKSSQRDPSEIRANRQNVVETGGCLRVPERDVLRKVMIYPRRGTTHGVAHGL